MSADPGARWLLALAACLGVLGCAIDFDDALPCDDDGDCLAEQRCNVAFGRCVGEGELTETDAGEDGEGEDAQTRDTGAQDARGEDADLLDAVDDVDGTGGDDTGDADASTADAGSDDVGADDASRDAGGEDAANDAGNDATGGDATGGDAGGADVSSDPIDCLPTTEVCDGVDNDCDGAVDEEEVCGACGSGALRVTTEAAGSFCIDVFEASREDATAESEGSATGAARSVSGVRPWSMASFEQAVAACATAGKRLCSSAEWIAACQGSASTLYPYGTSYDAAACNGPNAPPLDQSAPAGSFAACTSENGVFDLSGNVAEWTSDLTLRGGGFTDSQLSLQCRSRRTPGSTETPSVEFGFRCCSNAR